MTKINKTIEVTDVTEGSAEGETVAQTKSARASRAPALLARTGHGVVNTVVLPTRLALKGLGYAIEGPAVVATSLFMGVEATGAAIVATGSRITGATAHKAVDRFVAKAAESHAQRVKTRADARAQKKFAKAEAKAIQLQQEDVQVGPAPVMA